MGDKKLDLKYLIVLFVAIIMTFVFHEFGHWLFGTLTGHKMIMTLNHASPVDTEFTSNLAEYFMKSGGPLFSILQAIIFLFAIKHKTDNYYLYPFVFAPILMRIITIFLTLLTPQDEAQISIFLGLGTWTIPLIVALFLLFVGYLSNKQLNINWKFNVVNGLIGGIYIFIVLFIDQRLQSILNIKVN